MGGWADDRLQILDICELRAMFSCFSTKTFLQRVAKGFVLYWFFLLSLYSILGEPPTRKNKVLL